MIEEYEPDEGDLFFCQEDGQCPFCGAMLRYRELIADADVGCDYCPDCGYEGGIG